MRVALCGFSKDFTSFYLNMFPKYDSIRAEGVIDNNGQLLSATPMRKTYFSRNGIKWSWLQNSETVLPLAVKEFLIKFSNTPEYEAICKEYEFIENYKEKWSTAPFPVTMVTVDAVVIQSGQILMVRRGQMPGKGLYALPGGYLAQDELLEDGAIRELIEETQIAISKDDLKKFITSSRVFDDPHRDARGRVITHAFRIDLPPRRTTTKITKKKIKLPENEPVVGSDDADFAKWIPLAEIKRENVFTDHMDIIRAMTGIG